MKKVILMGSAIAAVAALSSCVTGPTPKYHVLKKDEYQIAGHPFKTTKDCERRAPIGKFDNRCDIPYAGFRGFTQPDIGQISIGSGSGTGSF